MAGGRVCCGLVALFCFFSGHVSAQFYYNESCRHATGSFSYYGHAPGYTAGFAANPDADGDGWLRLTNTATWQNGYVLLDKSFNADMGVTIEFSFSVWAPAFGGGLADGFCVFLFDGDPAKTFKIGSGGASLGYVNLQPAYLGVGIDTYGNFSNRTDANSGKGGPGHRPHSISIRKADYYYVTGTAARMGTNTYLCLTTTRTTRPQESEIYRRVRITVEPISDPGKEGMTVTVYLKTSPDGNFTAVLGPVDVEQTTPQTLRLGFVGSTGAGYAYHEVRDVSVHSPGDLIVFKTVDDCPTPGNVGINTIIVNTDKALPQSTPCRSVSSAPESRPLQAAAQWRPVPPFLIPRKGLKYS
jgi:hypothetical protein